MTVKASISTLWMLVVISAVLVRAQFQIEPGILYEDVLQPGTAHYYNFTVGPNVRHAVVSATALSGVYAPNILVGIDYVPDERHAEMSSQASSAENYISVVSSDYVFWSGQWILSLVSSDTTNVTFRFSVNLYECINNCTARGSCHADSGLCSCFGEYSGTDCSIEPFITALPANFSDNVGPDGDWDVFRLELPARYAYATRHLYVCMRVL